MSRNESTILYLGNFILPDKNAAAQRVSANAKLFRSLGFKVILLGVGKKGEEKCIQNHFGKYNFQISLFSETFFKSITSLWEISKIENILEKDQSIKAVICYNYRSIAMWRLKKLCSKKKIVCIADTTEWYAPHGNVITRIVTSIDTFLRMKVIQPRMDGLIPTSKFLYDYYFYYNIPMVILPTLMDIDEMPELNMHDGKRRELIFFGSAGPDKDRLDIIISILNQVLNFIPKVDFMFTVIGMTEEECKRVFSSFSISPELRKHILFTGRLERKKVLEAVATADFTIFIRPDNRVCKAGFPTKFSESVTCGTPVITNLTSDLATYLVEGENGWFIDIKDEVASAKKIHSLMSMSRQELLKIKKDCAANKTMDFRSFCLPVERFFHKLGL